MACYINLSSVGLHLTSSHPTPYTATLPPRKSYGFPSDLGCEWGCMQGGEGKLRLKSSGCRCLTSRSNGADVTLGSTRLALSEGVVWVLPKLSDWLDSAAQVKEKNKSSYQTCYTMLFALLFSIFSTISTVHSTLWKTRTKPCSTGEGFSSGHQMNHSLSKTYFFSLLQRAFWWNQSTVCQLAGAGFQLRYHRVD